jgi:predicted transposase YbfD/YdcC
MHSTALPIAAPSVSAEEQAALLKPAPLVSLYEAFAVVPDPRWRHGLRSDLPYLLTCLVAALLCNCNSTEAVGQWCHDHELLLRTYFGPRDFYTPTGSLYRHLLPLLDAQAIEMVLATWVVSSRPRTDEEAIALDGKVLRGADTAEQPAPHLLAFCTHESQETLLQVRVSEKTNEIPIAKAVLPCLPNTPRVYTADALHTHADFMQVVHNQHGFSLLTVKGNQPTLFADLHLYFTDPATSFLPHEQADTIDRRRGRTEERSILITTALNDYLRPSWPLVQQVAQLTRTVRVPRTDKITEEVVYLITDLPLTLATPSRLLELNRGHWSIENRLHYVRDVSFGEDRSRLRTGQAPQILAALRNLAITLIHRQGSTQIAASRRHFASHPSEALLLLLPRRFPQQ